MMSTSVATIYFTLLKEKKKKKEAFTSQKILPGPSVRGFALCYS